MTSTSIPFSLPASDNTHIIYGFIDRAPQNPQQKKRLLVLAHGLTASAEDSMHVEAARYFNESGFDVVRFNFYGGGEKSRTLHNATLIKHADDLSRVVAHYRNSYDKIYIAGHSYGGLTALFAQISVTAYAFWDSSFVPSWWQETSYNESNQSYCWKWGWGDIGQAMYDEAKNQTLEKSIHLASKIKNPSLVVIAGQEINDDEHHSPLYDALCTDKKQVIIQEADHTFSSKPAMESLLATTKDWFLRFD